MSGQRLYCDVCEAPVEAGDVVGELIDRRTGQRLLLCPCCWKAEVQVHRAARRKGIDW